MITTRKYKCLVVDDEPIARQIIQTYISQMPCLECVGECKNAFEAFERINLSDAVDIVFLDINMPNLNGVALVKILTQSPQIIFTTAYSEYAVESYELNAADYLLKPFLFERFAQAAFKAIKRLHDAPPTLPANPLHALDNQSIFIKSEGEKYPVALQNILYCEALKNYTRVVLMDGKEYCPLVSISKFEEDLAAMSGLFLRIHRSFLVSKKHLKSIGTNYVMIGNHKVPIGEQYKAQFFSQVGIT